MAGLYIHVPFCKKICSYCDFYKTTIISDVPDYLNALEMELVKRKNYLNDEPLHTIYFGGGTPSVLSIEQINRLLLTIYTVYRVSEDCEITLEANPDDLSLSLLKKLKNETGINRLSIGIQSFNDDYLTLLNRRHTASQAVKSLHNAKMAGFSNISIDLIYGLPGMSVQEWQRNLETAFSLNIEHLSAYHLTIEPRTLLAKQVSKGAIQPIDEEESSRQFMLLNTLARKNGFIHYEISNLAKEGYFSKHNSNYWLQKPYLGVGPSAHSYDLISRQWNVCGVKRYIKALFKDEVFYELEELDLPARFNEYLMVSLRTAKGVDVGYLRTTFGEACYRHFSWAIGSFICTGHLKQEDTKCYMTLKGWLISDFILTQLIAVNK